MIAVVLLIAFTVAIGGIISLWLTSLTSTTTSSVSSSAEKRVKCSASTLVVKEVRYNGTTPGANVSQYVNVTIAYETGSENLYNLSVEVTGGGVTTRATPLYTTTDNALKSGTSKAFSLNITRDSTISPNNVSMPPEYVRARAYCQSDTPIVGECKSGQSCMKQVAS